MTKQFWTKFVHHEHLAKTQLLTRDQRGGYYDIFNACFLQGGFVPDDDRVLAQITTSTPEEWAQLRPVMERLFCVDKDGWSHPDLLAEMSANSAKIKARKEAGRKGGKSKAKKDKENQASKSQPFASVLPCQLQLQSQLELEQKQKKEASSYVGVSNPARAREAEQVYRSTPPPEAMPETPAFNESEVEASLAEPEARKPAKSYRWSMTHAEWKAGREPTRYLVTDDDFPSMQKAATDSAERRRARRAESDLPAPNAPSSALIMAPQSHDDCQF